jgi:hypothetical protein
VVVATAVAERRIQMAKAYEKGKYTESKDEKKDKAMTKGMSPKEKAEFKKKDEAHGNKKKPKTMKEDKKMDAKIIKGIKAKKK